MSTRSRRRGARRRWPRGCQPTTDFNGRTQCGVGFYDHTRHDGARWSTADAYLRPATARPNLRLETGAHVSAIVVEGGRATGVRYVQDGAPHEVRAGHVVLAAGTVRSAQLLLLSGLGPCAELERHGIRTVVDSPSVGAGLQDHPECTLAWPTPAVRNLWECQTPEAMAQWAQERRGPMASAGTEIGGFALSRPDLDAPDLQLGAVPGPPPLPPGPPETRAVSTIVFAVAPRSRGRVRLRSSGATAMPLIDVSYLADEADVDCLVAGARLARRIAAAEPLTGITGAEIVPGSDVDDDDALRDWVRGSVGTAFHPTSTCAMGSDDTAVCDGALRVRGVDALHIVDASVMPAVPRGNTNGPTIALAERAADLLRGNTPLAPEATPG